jgi:hypothetical protein
MLAELLLTCNAATARSILDCGIAHSMHGTAPFIIMHTHMWDPVVISDKLESVGVQLSCLLDDPQEMPLCCPVVARVCMSWLEFF